MRFICYIIILVLLFIAPVKRLDIAILQPVQTIAVYTEPGAVVLQTDTNMIGRGKSVSEAVANLEENTPGVIYMDTVEYLLVSHDAKAYVEPLQKYLSPNVLVSMWDGKNGVDIASKYLAEEGNLPKLKSLVKILEKRRNFS